jgi:hypothetical protein
VGESSSRLDSLAADDLHAMFGPQLLDRLDEWLRQQNRLAAVIRTVRECERTQASESDGLKTMQCCCVVMSGCRRRPLGRWCGRVGRWSTCWRPGSGSPTGR